MVGHLRVAHHCLTPWTGSNAAATARDQDRTQDRDGAGSKTVCRMPARPEFPAPSHIAVAIATTSQRAEIFQPSTSPTPGWRARARNTATHHAAQNSPPARTALQRVHAHGGRTRTRLMALDASRAGHFVAVAFERIALNAVRRRIHQSAADASTTTRPDTERSHCALPTTSCWKACAFLHVALPVNQYGEVQAGVFFQMHEPQAVPSWHEIAFFRNGTDSGPSSELPAFQQPKG